jgi:hypothetical protein
MKRPLLKAVRFLSPKLRQRLDLECKQRASRDPAYQNAREVAEAAGPWRMAHDLGIASDLPLDTIAELAAVDYNPKARAAARLGHRDGFDVFLAGGSR